MQQRVQKVPPPPVGGAGAAGGDIAVTPYALPACALFLSKFLKEYVLCPRTPRSERGAAGPHPASCTFAGCGVHRTLHPQPVHRTLLPAPLQAVHRTLFPAP